MDCVHRVKHNKYRDTHPCQLLKIQDIDRLPIILRNKSKVVSNYCALKNDIKDLSLFENSENFKMTKKFIEKC
jgi:hypothetical protein